MRSIDDFINWWLGFRSAIDPNNISEEHLNILGKKINGLQDLWDISLPSREEHVHDYERPTWFPAWHFPEFIKQPEHPYPRVPDIWCRENQQYPKVGTPEVFGTPRHVN